MYTDITGYHSQDGREVNMNMILVDNLPGMGFSRPQDTGEN